MIEEGSLLRTRTSRRAWPTFNFEGVDNAAMLGTTRRFSPETLLLVVQIKSVWLQALTPEGLYWFTFFEKDFEDITL